MTSNSSVYSQGRPQCTESQRERGSGLCYLEESESTEEEGVTPEECGIFVVVSSAGMWTQHEVLLQKTRSIL